MVVIEPEELRWLLTEYKRRGARRRPTAVRTCCLLCLVAYVPGLSLAGILTLAAPSMDKVRLPRSCWPWFEKWDAVRYAFGAGQGPYLLATRSGEPLGIQNAARDLRRLGKRLLGKPLGVLAIRSGEPWRDVRLFTRQEARNEKRRQRR